MEDLTNILEPEDELNAEQLKKYVSGEISPDEMHIVEKQMADSEFVNDAVEGLQAISSKQKLDNYVDQLNKNLHQHLISKRQVKDKRRIKDISWIIVAIIVILLLCILAYIVVKMQHEKQTDKNSISVQWLFKNNEHNKGSFIL
jgi:hypothetical protein